MKVKVFTVFHRAIDERLLFDLFDPSEIEEYFVLYGVNASYPTKRVTKRDGRALIAGPQVSNALLEYQLPWHDESIQSRGFMETSCYVHLLNNAIHEPYDYIGVAQYDMRWPEPAAALVAAEPSGGRNVAYGMILGIIMNPQGQFHPLAFADRRNWAFLLQSYNRFFHRNWDARMLVNKPFTLFQTYLLPRQEFADLAAWLSVLCTEVYPWATEPPYETHWGSLSGFTERAESLFIAARMQEGRIALEPLPLQHDPAIVAKLALSKYHYGNPPAKT